MTMDLEQLLDHNVVAIKEKLNKDLIKLWLPPYYCAKDGKNKTEIEKLADAYSTQLTIPLEVCRESLMTLQERAIDNLHERDLYQATGQATLKVRVPSDAGTGKIIPVRIELFKHGSFLLDVIGKEMSLSPERLKVVFKGKVLKETEPMDTQGVKHGFTLMAIVLQENSLSTSESHAKLLNSTKADIQTVTKSRKKNRDQFLQVADQSGKPLDLPPEEQKALVLAMTLHEKGRAALKKEDFSLALVMLLEAEKEFSHCNSALLKSVDNYGLLNLDIAWCYLNLQSVTQLPDAAERLQQCESSLRQSYGSNFERLIALKGSSGNESALFMRLHLLQAIVFFHQNKLDQAKELFKQVEEELRRLEVDDSQLSHLIELGYGAAEARLALRQAEGQISTAVSIIENKREEREKFEETERKRRELRREQRKLGKCKNGNWVWPDFHKRLMNMGYSYEASRWALMQTNNNIGASVDIVGQYLPGEVDVQVDDEAVQQVASFGFEQDASRSALKKFKGNVHKAIGYLFANGGNVSDSYTSESDSSSSSDDGGPSTSTAEKKERKEAYSRLKEGLATTEEDHLDLNLHAEVAFLKRYKELLLKR